MEQETKPNELPSVDRLPLLIRQMHAELYYAEEKAKQMAFLKKELEQCNDKYYEIIDLLRKELIKGDVYYSVIVEGNSYVFDEYSRMVVSKDVASL